MFGNTSPKKEEELYDDYGMSQPAQFATVDPSSSTPRYYNVPQERYTPYQNNPVSRVIPRKKYVILPPSGGRVVSNPYPTVRYLRQVRDSANVQNRIIHSVNRPHLHWTSSTGSSVSGSFQTERNLQYVFKIPSASDNKPVNRQSSSMMIRTDSSVLMDDQVPISLHIPTVPANMSMGGEYVEEVEDGDEIELSSPSVDLFDSRSLNRIDSNSISCTEMDCFWRGSSLTALHRHSNTQHQKNRQIVVVNKKANPTGKGTGKPKGVRCSECDAMAYSRPLLLKHMTMIHGLEAPLINRTFESREDLQIWLEELRSSHAVEFVVSSGSKKWGYGLQVHYLTCSRSGEQKERPNKKNARPPRPSIKCGKNCMAYLKIKQNPVTSTLQIEGCLHHSGHNIDGRNIKLSQSELRKIANVSDLYDRNQLHWDIHNMCALREVLSDNGRFRLIPDNALISLLPEWINEYKSLHVGSPSSYFSQLPQCPDETSFELLDSDLILSNFAAGYEDPQLISIAK